MFGLSILVLFGSILVFYGTQVTYKTYFGRLSKIPGPRIWAATRLPYVYYLCKGRLVHRIRDLHEQYGPWVRIAPDEVSFSDPRAWAEIYSSANGRPAFPKHPIWHQSRPGEESTIMTALEPDHARMRLSLSKAFSDSELRLQEPLVISHSDILVRKLRQLCSHTQSAATIDLVAWVNYVVFDITGDLCFSESFQCLENSQLHPWISSVFSFFKFKTLVVAMQLLGLDLLLLVLIPRSVVAQREYHLKEVRGRTERRLNRALADSKPDFISALTQANKHGDLSNAEIEGNMGVFIMAGSETTATSLSAVFNYLMSTPQAYQCLVLEIRATFNASKLPTFKDLEQCMYLNAVIQEGLRLCAPIPCGIPRVVPPTGGSVCGTDLPPHTAVSVHNFSINRSKQLWKNGEQFVPERWLRANKENPESPYFSDQREGFKPFALGPRRCLGNQLASAEMKMILAKLLLAFEFTPVTKDSQTATSNVAWHEQNTFSLWSKEPFHVRIEPLN